MEKYHKPKGILGGKCGCWIYKGSFVEQYIEPSSPSAIFTFPQKWKGQEFRICDGCGECQQHISCSRWWFTITLEEMMTALEKTEAQVKKEKQLHERLERERIERKHKEDEEKVRRTKELEESRKRTLEWLKPTQTAGYRRNMPSEEAK